VFAKWGSLAYRRRWVVLIATVLLSVMGGAWGLGVFDRLSQGGYEAPSSEAARANKVAQDAFGRQGGDVLVIYTAPQGSTVDSPDLKAKVEHQLDGLSRDAVRRAA
jgi:RND superfamily putative drug exporter